MFCISRDWWIWSDKCEIWINEKLTTEMGSIENVQGSWRNVSVNVKMYKGNFTVL